MDTWVFIVGLVGSLLAGILVFLGPEIYAWFRHRTKQLTPPDIRPLHEQYPQILTWKEGDTFENNTFWAGKAELLSVTADGRVFLRDYERTYNWSLAYVTRHAHNMDATERRVTDQLKNSTEYMALLNDFQQAVKELERRDTERIGAPIQDVLRRAAE